MTFRSALPLALVLAAYAGAAWSFIDLPLIEDDKFWWVPKAMAAAERGLSLVIDGELPGALLAQAAGPPPPQWSGGLPDYGHPPLFFWYLALFYRALGPTVATTHVALIPLGLLALLGTARLARALGAGPHASAGAAAMLMAWPVFFAQGLRADLDVALIAVVPFALEAVVRQRWAAFGALAWLAVWIKEPGVLLGAAAGGMWLAIYGPAAVKTGLGAVGRGGWHALAMVLQPLVALGAWGGAHRWQTGWALASPERLPDGGAGLAADALMATRWLLVEQGRWAAVALVVGALVWRQSRGRLGAGAPRLALMLFVATVALFFSVVGFFGASAGRAGGATHLRYFLPAMPALAALAAVSAQALSRRWMLIPLAAAVALGLGDLRGAPWGGPERNLFGADLALARKVMAEEIRGQVAKGERVWVGMAEIPDMQFPAVGGVEVGIPGLERFGPETDPDALRPGDIVMVSAYGEPPGRLKARLAASTVALEVRRGRAWVRLIQVQD